MPKSRDKYLFRRHANADARRRSAERLIEVLLQPDSEILPEHRREFLKTALWKLTEAESIDKYGTRYCSDAAFTNPNQVLRHDHVYQRATMVDKLLKASQSEIAEILAPAVGCTITEEEHRLLNNHKHLDGWARYEAAQIRFRDLEPS